MRKPARHIYYSWRAGTCALAALGMSLSYALAHLNVPPPPQNHPILLTGATIHPVSSATIPRGQLLFENGKITALGRKVRRPAGTEIIDLSGKHIYPGLIAAGTSLGLIEISAVRATRDLVEPGDINPNARAEVAVNPDSELLPVARANGILTALTVPRPSNRKGDIAGTSALIKLEGWTWEEMTYKAPVGLHIYWPAPPSEPWYERGKPYDPAPSDKEIKEHVKKIEEAFAAARAYRLARQNSSTSPDSDLRWEAMIPVVEGVLPVFVHANDLRQIKSAIFWAEREAVKLVIVGGQDAHYAVDLLRERNIPVIISPVFSLPKRRWEPYDTPFTNPRILSEAGIPFCITSWNVGQERNLPYQAAMAAAHGLPRDEALKSITLYPAQILGVDDRLGSLEPGKDATFIVTDGDPLEIMTQVERAFIDGRPIDLSSRHTRLYDKYRQKYNDG